MLKNVALFVMNVLLGKEKGNTIYFQRVVVLLKKQICRDRVMNDILSWCMHLLTFFS